MTCLKVSQEKILFSLNKDKKKSKWVIKNKKEREESSFCNDPVPTTSPWVFLLESVACSNVH